MAERVVTIETADDPAGSRFPTVVKAEVEAIAGEVVDENSTTLVTLAGSQTITGQKTFTGILEVDNYVQVNAPDPGSTSASITLNNGVGGQHAFFENADNDFGVYDNIAGKQPFTIEGGSPDDALRIAPGGLSTVLPLDMNGHKITEVSDGTNPGDAINLAQLVAALLAKIDVSTKGQSNGVAPLDSTGKLPPQHAPDIAVVDFLGVAANQAAMLAFVGQKGDWCTRSDSGTDWQIIGTNPTQLASWRQMTYPASPVASVAGLAGIITDTGLRSALGLVIGTNVQAYSALLAGLAAASIPASGYRVVLSQDGGATWTAFGTTSTGRSLLAAADAAAIRTLAGLDQVDNTSDVTKNLVVANPQTASYTLALTDAAKAVEMNVASANTVTVPPNSSVAFPIGSVVELLSYGAGQTTVVAGAGVTIRSPGGKLKLTSQYSGAALRKRATDEWVLVGDLSA